MVLTVLGGLVLLLVLGCLWEARSGRPEWGRRASGEPITARQAAARGKGQAAAAAVTAAAVVVADTGGDG